jgi:hypothetical protein
MRQRLPGQAGNGRTCTRLRHRSSVTARHWATHRIIRLPSSIDARLPTRATLLPVGPAAAPIMVPGNHSPGPEVRATLRDQRPGTAARTIPPSCMAAGSMPVKTLTAQILAFCATTSWPGGWAVSPVTGERSHVTSRLSGTPLPPPDPTGCLLTEPMCPACGGLARSRPGPARPARWFSVLLPISLKVPGAADQQRKIAVIPLRCRSAAQPVSPDATARDAGLTDPFTPRSLPGSS